MGPPQQSADGHVYVSLAQLMALEFAARGLSFNPRQPRASLLSGNHASRLRGRGLDFDELRRYQPGDDLRHLDCKASLRSGTPIVRTWTEERDRPLLLVLDQRMSMFFGSRVSFKSAIAAELAALCAWIALKGGDRVGAVIFDDQDCQCTAPLRSRARVQAICASAVKFNQRLAADVPAGDSTHTLDDALRRCLQVARHDHLVCLISDFAGAGDNTLKQLRQLRAHNDVLALQVYDPLALDLPERGRLVISQGQLQVALAMERQRIRQPLSDFLGGRLKEVAQLLRRSQVPLMMFSTALSASAQLRLELGRLQELQP
ncbi:DUF58 domain-containing protein [Pseudomonas putida]|uniref:DUF58 domain-containing protein n=1 Tax=Pseudomonas putida TaxID=303 RepID=A0A1Q9QX32_PSEPU|nr:DUF58 domain-containing protein [Pseudomonas putida]OLS59711.1 hypothetical protein PSEMO_56820 [Pseudomonas putida]